jgi:hypothetical protein
MPKKKPRITRLGLPEKTERIVIAVTPGEKADIRKWAAESKGTVSQYLLVSVAMAREFEREVASGEIGERRWGRRGKR